MTWLISGALCQHDLQLGMETDVDMSRPLADGASPTDDWAGITQRDDDGIAADDRDLRSRADGPDKVLIELSRAQVDRIVRNAADGGNMSVLLSGLKDIRVVLAREPRQLEDSRLSRSLLAGLLMLASFPSDGSYIGNAEIARLLDMNPSTTHRYVSTLVAVGLLERDPATRRYRLT
jgi:hypothetical protein